ncbi:hypothetical protein Tco_0315971 [Tanacetum coccineum]
MVYVVNGTLASDVDMVLEKDFASFALQEMEIHPLMLLIRTLSMILQTFSPTLHNLSTNHTRVNYVGTTLIMYPIDQSPPQEMNIHDMELQKQQYLEEMQSISNQIQIKDYRNERIDIRYRRECEIKIDERKEKFNGMSIEINKKKELRQLEQAANLSTYTIEPSRRFNSFYDEDDDEESTIPLNKFFFLNTSVYCNHTHEVIKSSVEDLVPIPSESEDTSDNDSECDLPFFDNYVTFSNPLFNANDDITSSDDESLLEEDVPEENFKIYSNPLFELDEEYISSNVNPLFNKVLKDIESEDSYVSKLDEPDLLVTPLSKLNKDECFDPG